MKPFLYICYHCIAFRSSLFFNFSININHSVMCSHSFHIQMIVSHDIEGERDILKGFQGYTQFIVQKGRGYTQTEYSHFYRLDTGPQPVHHMVWERFANFLMRKSNALIHFKSMISVIRVLNPKMPLKQRKCLFWNIKCLQD